MNDDLKDGDATRDSETDFSIDRDFDLPLEVERDTIIKGGPTK
jgi:hypothetical protein